MDCDNSDPVQAAITQPSGRSGGGVVGGATCGWWCLATNWRKVTTGGATTIHPFVRSFTSIDGNGRGAVALWMYGTCVTPTPSNKHEKVSQASCSCECKCGWCHCSVDMLLLPWSGYVCSASVKLNESGSYIKSSVALGVAYTVAARKVLEDHLVKSNYVLHHEYHWRSAIAPM